MIREAATIKKIYLLKLSNYTPHQVNAMFFPLSFLLSLACSDEWNPQNTHRTYVVVDQQMGNNHQVENARDWATVP